MRNSPFSKWILWQEPVKLIFSRYVDYHDSPSCFIRLVFTQFAENSVEICEHTRPIRERGEISPSYTTSTSLLATKMTRVRLRKDYNRIFIMYDLYIWIFLILSYIIIYVHIGKRTLQWKEEIVLCYRASSRELLKVLAFTSVVQHFSRYIWTYKIIYDYTGCLFSPAHQIYNIILLKIWARS